LNSVTGQTESPARLLIGNSSPSNKNPEIPNGYSAKHDWISVNCCKLSELRVVGRV
jgi:hypothetical protein